MEDNDTKAVFYDVQGESVYTNPPDSNMPTIDHGLDEDHIWAWSKTPYNQNVIKNPYIRNPESVTKSLGMPHWGGKMMMPSFFKEEKLEKFFKQWSLKNGLAEIQMRQALTHVPGDKKQYR